MIKIEILKEMLLKGYKLSVRQKYELWKYINQLEVNETKSLDIKTYKVKQYNSTTKTVIVVNGEPVCICGSGKTSSTILSYLQGYSETISDGKIKKRLDKYKENKNESRNNR